MKVSRELRDLVVRRAQDACEHCRLPQIASLVPHQVDHIIGKQHRGSDDAANLCLCCIRCNLNKGPNIASIDPETGSLVALYHRSINAWREHFAAMTDGVINGLTAEGRATVLILAMNEDDRVRLRRLLMRQGRYL
jgi:hypothetical protein